ncbi:hypothetical protein KI387_004198, partial [Taxus chinensis]
FEDAIRRRKQKKQTEFRKIQSSKAEREYVQVIAQETIWNKQTMRYRNQDYNLEMQENEADEQGAIKQSTRIPAKGHQWLYEEGMHTKNVNAVLCIENLHYADIVHWSNMMHQDSVHKNERSMDIKEFISWKKVNQRNGIKQGEKDDLTAAMAMNKDNLRFDKHEVMKTSLLYDLVKKHKGLETIVYIRRTCMQEKDTNSGLESDMVNQEARLMVENQVKQAYKESIEEDEREIVIKQVVKVVKPCMFEFNSILDTEITKEQEEGTRAEFLWKRMKKKIEEDMVTNMKIKAIKIEYEADFKVEKKCTKTQDGQSYQSSQGEQIQQLQQEKQSKVQRRKLSTRRQANWRRKKKSNFKDVLLLGG